MSNGKEVKAAFAKAVAWGTAVACVGTDVVLITKESIPQSIEHLPDDLAGQYWPVEADQGLITCGGELAGYLRYEALGKLLAMAMGAASAPATLGGGAYLHQLRMTGTTDGLFGTLAVFKGFSVHEYASVKVDGFTIEGMAGQPVQVTFHLICDGLTLNTSTGANTVAGMEALSAPDSGNRILFHQGQFWLNDKDGGALGQGDEIYPSRFVLSFRRNLTGDHLAGGNQKIAEPVMAAFPEISLTLEFPTYSSDTYLDDLGSDTRKKMKISFTAQEIAPGVSFGFSLFLPHLVLTNATTAVDRAGKIQHPLTADILGAASAPEGMEGITAPLAIDVVNTEALGFLA